MSLVSLSAHPPVPQADARLVDVNGLKRQLEAQIEGEVRFDNVSRALYSTDASVYQMEPLGVVVVRSRDDLIATMRLCSQYRCPLTLRGGGTSQAGQAIGNGLLVDTSKFYNRVIEVNAGERWARIEPGIVLDELNAQLRSHSLRFAPDVSTASRATIGGMISNNSSGARSVLYGKTIDHVLDLTVLLSDGSVADLRALGPEELERKCAQDTLEAACCQTVRRLASQSAAEIERRFPKVLRRVGGYNLDEFVHPDRPFNLAKLIVGSEGTLAVVLEARLNLVALPRAKAVLTVEFHDLLDALAATPLILEHRPSAVEVMDKFILDHTRQSPTLDRIRNSLIEGDPGAVLCVELYDESAEALLPRLDALERDLRQHQFGYRSHRALDLAEQARIWNLRESALGLSMAMKEDAKSVAFVEDTAVAPEKLRAYIERFLGIVRRHQTSAGVYAHASVGCLHVRPVVNLKTEQGIQKFESIANEVSDLVLEFGGALSGEHGDGLVRSPFMQKMFGAELYEAFRSVKRTFDPIGILNPGKIVDSPPLTANLRFGSGYRTPTPATYFDYSEYGGLGGAVEMCSGLGVCRKRREGTMCPSYMATGEEAHSTRGRANVLRLAMAGRLGEAGLGEQGVYDVLDLCLECRACKSECPVGVDVARFKSEFLADYQNRHGVPLAARLMGNLPEVARWGSRSPALANRIASSRTVRWAAERFLGIDRRRRLPYWRTGTAPAVEREADILLFHDTFTKYYEPEIATAALEVFKAAGLRAGVAPNLCCGRTLISKGLLSQARELAARNIARLVGLVRGGIRLVFCEPSCLSAMREDVPSLLRGELQQQARMVADACVSFEEALAALPLELSERRARILLHGHCHQRAMGLVPASVALLSRIPGARVVDLDAGCCGMAGSFGYSKDHYEVSRQIAERKLLPALRNREAGDIVVASGFSCRHQVSDFAAVDALHPASLIRGLLRRAV